MKRNTIMHTYIMNEHCTLYIVHCTLYNVQCTMYNVHSLQYLPENVHIVMSCPRDNKVDTHEE